VPQKKKELERFQAHRKNKRKRNGLQHTTAKHDTTITTRKQKRSIPARYHLRQMQLNIGKKEKNSKPHQNKTNKIHNKKNSKSELKNTGKKRHQLQTKLKQSFPKGKPRTAKPS